MTKEEEKAHHRLGKHRDMLAVLARSVRTGFTKKEQQHEFMRIAGIIQDASDACDVAVLKLERNDEGVDDYTRARIRLREKAGKL